MIDDGSQNLRELIRILIRNLGVLEKSDSSCSGVTLSQCHALVEIGRKGKLSLVELSEVLRLDKSTMSRTIHHLVEADLVSRELDAENRRYVVIQLTAKGQGVFKTIEQSMEGYYSSIYADIPEEKRAQVLESLQLLIDAMKSNNACT